jgi:hypothetical protein
MALVPMARKAAAAIKLLANFILVSTRFIEEVGTPWKLQFLSATLNPD